MSGHNSKNSIKKLASLVGVASASAFLCLPALALNLNSSNFYQLLAQSPSGGTTGGTTDGTTGGATTDDPAVTVDLKC